MWEPTDGDRRTEVDHVDRVRRPWRAAVFAIAALGLGLVIVPRPLPLVAVGLVAGGAVLAGVAAWRLPLIRSDRAAPGRRSTVELTVGEEAVTLRRDGLERTLAPAALRGLVVGPDHVFVHLVGGEVVTVPTRVFPERGGLDRFVLAVERFRKRGRAPSEEKEAGYDRWSLRYRLDARRLAPPAGQAGEVERRVLAGLAALALVLVAAASDPWGGGLDLVLVALFAATVAALLALTGRQRRVAVGPVHARFGAAGGQVSGPAGVLRFGWAEVQGVSEGAHGVVIGFPDRVLPIPGTAFASAEDQSRFVGQVEDWCQAAHPAPPPRSERVDRPVEQRENPFAPPDS